MQIPNDPKYATAAAAYVSEIARTIGMPKQDLAALEKGIIDQKKMDLIQEDILVAAEVLENSIENYNVRNMKCQYFSERYSKHVI